MIRFWRCWRIKMDKITDLWNDKGIMFAVSYNNMRNFKTIGAKEFISTCIICKKKIKILQDNADKLLKSSQVYPYTDFCSKKCYKEYCIMEKIEQ